MNKITVDHTWGDATAVCDCGMWKKTDLATDIDIVAVSVSHIRENHSEGIIEFTRRIIIFTDTSMTVVNK